MEKIGESAFCQGFLTEITVPSTVVEICDYAFSNHHELERFVLLPGTKSARLGEHVIGDWGNIEEIVIPGNYTYIGSNFSSISVNTVRWERSTVDENQQIGGKIDCKNFYGTETITKFDKYSFERFIKVHAPADSPLSKHVTGEQYGNDIELIIE